MSEGQVQMFCPIRHAKVELHSSYTKKDAESTHHYTEEGNEAAHQQVRGLCY
jgi:hypothetical protein